MAYCTSDDVALEFKGIAPWSSSTIPTSDAVDDFIEQSDGLIDARIGVRYSTPVTGTVSLIILKQISIWLVAGRIQNILRVKTGKEEVDQAGGVGSLLTKANKLLDQIAAREVILSDATEINAHMGMKSYNADNSITPTFERSTDVW